MDLPPAAQEAELPLRADDHAYVLLELVACHFLFPVPRALLVAIFAVLLGHCLEGLHQVLAVTRREGSDPACLSPFGRH